METFGKAPCLPADGPETTLLPLGSLWVSPDQVVSKLDDMVVLPMVPVHVSA